MDYRLKHDYAQFVWRAPMPARCMLKHDYAELTETRLGKKTVAKDDEVVVEEIEQRQVTSEDQ